MEFILAWHANERFDDAYPLDEDGDGVLIQWGTYRWDAARTRQFDVTRQLTTAEGPIARLLRRRTDDVSLWQVSLPSTNRRSSRPTVSRGTCGCSIRTTPKRRVEIWPSGESSISSRGGSR